MRAQLSIFICLCLVLCFFASSWAAAADSDLVAWWRFDEGSGTVARDATGNGNDGTVVGATWLEGSWNGAGHCLEFIYGEADRVAIGPSSGLNSGTTSSQPSGARPSRRRSSSSASSGNCNE